MGFLAIAPDRTSAWWSHADLGHSFCGAKAGIEGSYKYLGLGPGGERVHLIEHEYKLYQRLCLAKHVNPVAEKTRYFTRWDGGQQLRVTPFASDRRIREARMGLLLAARAATLAVWVFHKCHLQQGETDEPRIASLAARTLALLDTWKDVAA
jgi:hypothetical protein